MRLQRSPDRMTADSIELIRLARSLTLRSGSYQTALDTLVNETVARIEADDLPVELERISEEFARALRQLWLEASAYSTSSSYRSPPTADATRTATGRQVEFGYERDLQPTLLEQRCEAFFDPPPEGWKADHIVLSSGQSAMAAILHALEGSSLFGAQRTLSFVHLGSYFETGEILSLFSSLLVSAGRGRDAVEAMDRIDGDIVIVEPVFCDGDFGSVDLSRLIALHAGRVRPRIYLFDTTLTGTRFVLERELCHLARVDPIAVVRIVSGLKLLQAGLELSSVGILSVFTRDHAVASAREIGDRIRKVRTLLGLGLSFSEVAALEVPWFLDRGYTETYEQAIFDNNALLARAVSVDNKLFDGTFHPSLLSQSDGICAAPYSTYRLRERDPGSYAVLEDYLVREARRRCIQFDLGGSFGFRGHRFEIVRPENGEEPFLRVALGRRAGWSRDEIVRLMTELSRRTSVSELRTL